MTPYSASWGKLKEQYLLNHSGEAGPKKHTPSLGTEPTHQSGGVHVDAY